MRQSPKGIPPAGSQKAAPNEESTAFIFEHYLETKVVITLEEKICLEGLNPPSSRTIGSNLIEVRPFENQAFCVVPQTETFGCFGDGKRFLEFGLVHTNDNNQQQPTTRAKTEGTPTTERYRCTKPIDAYGRWLEKVVAI
jgi:hypothetical protein